MIWHWYMYIQYFIFIFEGSCCVYMPWKWQLGLNQERHSSPLMPRHICVYTMKKSLVQYWHYPGYISPKMIPRKESTTYYQRLLRSLYFHSQCIYSHDSLGTFHEYPRIPSSHSPPVYVSQDYLVGWVHLQNMVHSDQSKMFIIVHAKLLERLKWQQCFRLQ